MIVAVICDCKMRTVNPVFIAVSWTAFATLNMAGKIIRTHGGAAHQSEFGENLPLSMRERSNFVKGR